MYFRLYENGEFSFTVEEFKKDGDILIPKEDYEKFQELQSQGKQFKIKDPTKNNLFEILEVIDNDHVFNKSENDSLKEEQSTQNNEILTNMLANTEMFEIILGFMPQHINLFSINSKETINIESKKGGSDNMVEVYVTLIIKGVKKIEDVPNIIKPQVIERLEQLGVNIFA